VSKQEREAQRIHAGFGRLRASQLKRLHVDRWIAAHPTWKGCRRTRIQALKRALNYCAEAGLIPANPIKGYKVAKQRQRRTYLTPEQEKACYEYANPALAIALKVCIRTGARYGCEFARLTARHITFTDRGMEWRFNEEESKTGRLRIIRIPNSEPVAREVIEIVKAQMKQYPVGPIFRNTQGKPWRQTHLGHAFSKLRKRLAEKGIELDGDSCMYMLRHTYAKRTLAGFWTGKPSTIEHLAELMGNTREVCWDHYASWCEAYTDPLWESA
jgi:integrase